MGRMFGQYSVKSTAPCQRRHRITFFMLLVLDFTAGRISRGRLGDNGDILTAIGLLEDNMKLAGMESSSRKLQDLLASIVK